MFSFFKNKGVKPIASTVDADVGASLVRQTSFPTGRGSAEMAARTVTQLALDGVPPQASLLDQSIAGQTTRAYLIESSGGQAPQAFVNINAGRASIELWELDTGEKPAFARQRAVRLDPEQNSWAGYLLNDVARLPNNRWLLAVFYYAPHVKQALFVYDAVADSYTKISNIVPHALDRHRFFEAQVLAPGATIVQYSTKSIRLAPEVYYNTPSHLRLFTPRNPQGIEIAQLCAADGSIEHWTVIDKTLWLATRDIRERGQPKEFVWSLNLERVLQD